MSAGTLYRLRINSAGKLPGLSLPWNTWRSASCSAVGQCLAFGIALQPSLAIVCPRPRTVCRSAPPHPSRRSAVRLQKPGPPESSGDGREHWRRSWPTISWPGRRIPKSAAPQTRTRERKSDRIPGPVFPVPSANARAPVRSIFRSLNPKSSLSSSASLAGSRLRSRYWAVCWRCCLSTPASCLRTKLSHLACSGLRFDKYSAYAFGSGAMPSRGISSGATELAKTPWRA